MVMRHPWEKGEEVESGLDGDGEAADNVLGEKLRTGGDEAVHAGQRARPRLQAHQPRERVAARLRNTAIKINQNLRNSITDPCLVVEAWTIPACGSTVMTNVSR